MNHTPPAVRRAARSGFLRCLLVVGAATLVAGGWYAFRPDRLLTTRVVDEAAPGAVDVPTVGTAGVVSSAAPSATRLVGDTGGAGAVTTLAAGRFHSNAHETRGTATLLDLGGGHRVLRLTGFATSNGPDVRVILVAAPDAPDDATVRRVGYVELGRLKGTRGDQNYVIPASLDLAGHRTVTIWCERFRVNFGSAPLTAR